MQLRKGKKDSGSQYQLKQQRSKEHPTRTCKYSSFYRTKAQFVNCKAKERASRIKECVEYLQDMMGAVKGSDEYPRNRDKYDIKVCLYQLFFSDWSLIS